MLSIHRSLVRAQQPAFKQGDKTKNVGHADVGRLWTRIHTATYYMWGEHLRQVDTPLI